MFLSKSSLSSKLIKINKIVSVVTSYMQTRTSVRPSENSEARVKLLLKIIIYLVSKKENFEFRYF